MRALRQGKQELQRHLENFEKLLQEEETTRPDDVEIFDLKATLSVNLMQKIIRHFLQRTIFH